MRALKNQSKQLAGIMEGALMEAVPKVFHHTTRGNAEKTYVSSNRERTAKRVRA
jgi:hypothetical protein